MLTVVNFDVFLSHNSVDKPDVEKIAGKLKDVGLEPWFDTWCLTPGENWQPALADGLRNCATCAVFIGPKGLAKMFGGGEKLRDAVNGLQTLLYAA